MNLKRHCICCGRRINHHNYASYLLRGNGKWRSREKFVCLSCYDEGRVVLADAAPGTLNVVRSGRVGHQEDTRGEWFGTAPR